MQHSSQPQAGCGLRAIRESEAGEAPAAPFPPPPRGVLAAAPLLATCPPRGHGSAPRMRAGRGVGCDLAKPRPGPSGGNCRPRRSQSEHRSGFAWRGSQQVNLKLDRGGEAGAGDVENDRKTGQWEGWKEGGGASGPAPSRVPARGGWLEALGGWSGRDEVWGASVFGGYVAWYGALGNASFSWSCRASVSSKHAMCVENQLPSGVFCLYSSCSHLWEFYCGHKEQELLFLLHVCFLLLWEREVFFFLSQEWGFLC